MKQEKKYEWALVQLQKINENPAVGGNYEFLFEQMSVLYSLEKYPEALKVLDRMNQMDASPTQKADILFNYGKIQDLQGQDKKAVDTFLQLSRSYPADPIAIEGLVQAKIIAKEKLKDDALLQKLNDLISELSKSKK